MITIAIVGSRDFKDLVMVDDAIITLEDSRPLSLVTIISGGARGVDKRAIKMARVMNYSTEEYLADWDKHGKPAGFIRNERMIDMADEVIAFWDGKSKGTKHSIDLALRYGKQLTVYFAETLV